MGMVGDINASFITGGVRNFYSVSTGGYPCGLSSEKRCSNRENAR